MNKTITKEDKCRIVARNFFTDNPDQYEDYHEALAEFMSGLNTSDQFIDFAVERYIKPEKGFSLYMTDAGHVAAIRDADGFFQPRTEMTPEEVEELEEAFRKAADDFPDLDGFDLIEKIGWRKIS